MKPVRSFMVLALLILFPLTAQAAMVGNMTHVQGRVDITSPGETAMPANVGDEVCEDDIIRTKSNSKAEVTFLDGNILRLAEETRVEIAEYVIEEEEVNGVLNLFRGKLQNIVSTIGREFGRDKQNRFEVHTPTAVCGVRGTSLFPSHLRGVSRVTFQEGEGYVYSKGRPDEERTVHAGQTALVVSADQPPMVSPATDEEMGEHVDDTFPSEDDGDDEGDDEGEGEGTGEGEGEGGTPEGYEPPEDEGLGDLGGDDTGDTGFDLGLDTEPDLYIPPDVPDEGPTTTYTDFSSTIPLDFLDEPAGDSATLSGSINDDTNEGTLSLSGSTSEFPEEDTWEGDFSATLSDGSALEGDLLGISGTWEGLLTSIYVTGDGGAGYIYGDLSGDYDPDDGTFDGSGSATRSSILGYTDISGYDDLADALDSDSDANEALFNVYIPVFDDIDIQDDYILLGEASSPGEIMGISTTGGSILGIWQYTIWDWDGSYSSDGAYTAEDPWEGKYGYGDYLEYYMLGDISGTDLDGHVTISGNLTYLDTEYLGSISLEYRGTYDGENYQSVGAGTLTLDPLAFSGIIDYADDWDEGPHWGIYADYYGYGFDDTYGDVYGLAGSVTSPWTWDDDSNDWQTQTVNVVYMGEYDCVDDGPNVPYIWNDDIYDRASYTYNDYDTFDDDDGAFYGFIGGVWNDRKIDARVVSLYMDPGGNIGYLTGSLEGEYYPEFYDYDYGEGMFEADGTWTATRMASAADIADMNILPEDFYDAVQTDCDMYANVSGDFNGYGDISGVEYYGWTRYIDGQNWGIYDIIIDGYDSGYNPYLTNYTSWSAKIGGDANFGTYFDDSSYVSDWGYWLANITDGTWEAGKLTGSLDGRFLTYTKMGDITGDILGYYDGSGNWAATSLGIYEGEPLAFSGKIGGQFYLDTTYSYGYGGFSGLMGDVAPLGSTTGSDFLALGDYNNPNNYLVWKGIVGGHGLVDVDGTGSVPDEDGYWIADIGGTDWTDGTMTGSLSNGLIITESYMGKTSGSIGGIISGEYYDEIGLWKAETFLPDFSTTEPLTSLASGFSGRIGGQFYSDITSSYGYGGFSGLMGDIAPLGTSTGSNFLAMGDYNNPYNGIAWQGKFGGQGLIDDGSGGATEGYWIADIAGDDWIGNTMTASLSNGIYLTDSMMGNTPGDIGGTLSGEYYDDIGYWKADTFTPTVSAGGTPLAFSGMVEWGSFGGWDEIQQDVVFDSRYPNYISLAPIEGLIGGTGSLFAAGLNGNGTTYDPAPFMGLGGYDSANINDYPLFASHIIVGGDDFGVDGYGYSDLYFGGIRDENNIEGKMIGLYVILDSTGETYEAGIISSNAITGTLHPDISMWETPLSSNLLTAEIKNFGLALPTVKESPVTTAALVEGDITGAGKFDSMSFYVDDQEEDWGIWVSSSGGTYAVTPTPGWEATTGWKETYDSGIDSYSIIHLTGTDSPEGWIAGTALGQFLTPNGLGTITGDILGVYGDNTWQAVSLGTWEEEPLAFSGMVEWGSFGGWNEAQRDVMFHSGNPYYISLAPIEGLIGGTGSLFTGFDETTSTYASAPFVGLGGYDSANINDYPLFASHIIVGGDDFGVDGYSDLYFGGIRDENNIEGKMIGLYVIPNDGTYEAGIISSNAITGTLYPDISMWETPLSSNLLTAERKNSGIALPTVVESPVTTAALIEGDITGTSTINSMSFYVYDQEEDWGIWVSESGGTYDVAPTPGWEATTGWKEINVEVVDSYNIIHLTGTDSPEGWLAGTASGQFLHQDGLGTITGDILGVYDDNTWQAVSLGTWVEEELAFGGLWEDGPGSIDEWGLIGGVTAPWAAPADFLAMGEYIDGGPGSYIWASNIEAEGEGGGFGGITGGIWKDGAMKGAAVALYGYEGGAGILTADVSGNYYPDLEMWMAEGTLIPIKMTTALYSDDDVDEADLLFVGSGNFSEGGGDINMEISEGFEASFIDDPFIEQDDWGIWGTMLGGTYTGTTSDDWSLDLDGHDPYDPALNIWAEVDGSQWSAGELAGKVSGAWVDLEDALTGVIGGEVIGNYNPTETTWQAVAAGSWMETRRFLDMAAVDYDSESDTYTFNTSTDTLAGTQALLNNDLNIPCIEVGRTSLSGGGDNLELVEMNDVTFFAYSTGAMPRIWATGDVSGITNGDPVGSTAILDGNGFNDVEFHMNNYGVSWDASVNGSGTVPGTSHDVTISGGAAGSVDTSTTFSGTGAGTASPTVLNGD